MTNITYRNLQANDCSRYKELRMRAFTESATAFSESFEDEQHEPSEYFESCIGFENEHFTLGAFDENDQLVGIATFKRDKRQKARHKSYIYTMYVAPEKRGKKIAKTMLEKLIEGTASMRDLEQVHLWVLNPDRSPATKLYESVGFKLQGPTVVGDLKIDGDYVDAGYMVLSLI